MEGKDKDSIYPVGYIDGYRDALKDLRRQSSTGDGIYVIVVVIVIFSIIKLVALSVKD